MTLWGSKSVVFGGQTSLPNAKPDEEQVGASSQQPVGAKPKKWPKAIKVVERSEKVGKNKKEFKFQVRK